MIQLQSIFNRIIKIVNPASTYIIELQFLQHDALP